MRKLMTILVKNPIFRRWVYIAFLSVVSTVIIYVVEDKLSVLDKSAKFSAGWPPILKYTVISLLTFIISLAVLRLGGIHPNFRFRTMMRYPPFWFAVLIAFTFFGVVINRKIGLSLVTVIFVVPYVIAVCIGIVLTFVSDIFTRVSWSNLVEPKKVKENYSGKGIFNSDEELLAWILEERPINSPYEDIFGLAISARKITQLLLTKTTSSIGILGPYGSGKSSLINLVEYYFAHRDEVIKNDSLQLELSNARIICCRIDGWGQTSGFVAQRILHLAIEKMKRYVDCTSLVGLPESYHKALAGTKSWGMAFLFALFQTSYDPVMQLVRLDDILTAADLRLVIFLEDLDRNISDEIIRDELPALLDRLRVLEQISFVLAIGTDRHYSDILIRVCDHVEAIA